MRHVAPSSVEPSRRARLAGDCGFTLVEVLIATMVLVIGLLAVLGMLTGAIGTTTSNNEYVGATNLARELVESARGADYDQLTPALLAPTLQARGMGAGDPWKITRRGVSYTIDASACLLDSPADGIESPAPASVCLPQLTGASGDQNGDDFRRVTFTISWTQRTRVRSLTQTELIVNPAGGLGPRITGVSPLTQTVITTATTASVTFTTSPAAGVHWHADDGKSQGDGVLSPSLANTWRADWPLGTVGAAGASPGADEVLDGAYQMIAQASDSRAVAGDAKLATIVLNRRKAYRPPTFAGGYDSRFAILLVDLTWGLSSERDIVGYRVYWSGLDGVVDGLIPDVRVCPSVFASATAMLATTTTSCTQLLPAITGLSTYYVVAVDRDSTGVLREGEARSYALNPLSFTRPSAPRGPLAATTVGGLATLSWTAPTGTAPIFYRIYRDDDNLSDRYDRTVGPTPTWTDATATSAHDYWITAVDSTYNESDPIGPVRWTPPS